MLSIFNTSPNWTASIAYAVILLLPVLIARTLALAKHKKRTMGIGIALIIFCTFIVSLKINIAVFYIVTSLPFVLIFAAVYFRRSHQDKNLHIEDIQ